MTQKPVYFTILAGLRGCYMPDNEPRVACATSYREFCSAIRDEAEFYGDDEEPLRSLGQHRFAWQHLKDGRNWREVCVYADKAGSWGVTVSPATQAEYEAQEAEAD